MLKKNKSRVSTAQREREKLFTQDLDKLFDISHSDALNMIKIEEDLKFLQDQRGPRIMALCTEDKKLIQKQQRSFERKLAEAKRRNLAFNEKCIGEHQDPFITRVGWQNCFIR